MYLCANNYYNLKQKLVMSLKSKLKIIHLMCLLLFNTELFAQIPVSDDVPEWFIHPKKGEYVGISVPMGNEKATQQSAEFSAIITYMIGLNKVKKDSSTFVYLHDPTCDNMDCCSGKVIAYTTSELSNTITNGEREISGKKKSNAFVVLYTSYDMSRRLVSKDGTIYVSLRFKEPTSNDTIARYGFKYSSSYSNGEKEINAVLSENKRKIEVTVVLQEDSIGMMVSSSINSKDDFSFVEKLNKMDKQFQKMRFNQEWKKMGYDNRGVSSECGIESPVGAGYLASVMNMFDEKIEPSNYFYGLQNVGNYFVDGGAQCFYMPIEIGKTEDVAEQPQINSRPNTNTFAVIFGNEKYLQAEDVPFAQNDAKSFMNYCIDFLNIPENQVSYYENATYGMMRAAVKHLKQASSAYKGDLNVVFYYAGHGVPDEETKSAYLLPTDADGTIPEVCYNLDQLYSELGSLNAKQIVVFLDACFSGSKRSGGMLQSARGVAIKSKPSKLQGNMVVFSAATDEQTALPYNDKEHGLFTYYLLNKLKRERGEVTLGKLAEYIKDEVSKTAISVNKKAQTPTIVFSPSMSARWSELKLK